MLTKFAHLPRIAAGLNFRAFASIPVSDGTINGLPVKVVKLIVFQFSANVYPIFRFTTLRARNE